MNTTCVRPYADQVLIGECKKKLQKAETSAQVCSIGDCKVNAQTTVKTVTKQEPKTVKLKITGMTCAGCSNNVAAALKAVDGVAEQKVEYPGDITTRKYTPAKTSVADIIKAIEKI